MKNFLSFLKPTVIAIAVTVVMSSSIPFCPPPGLDRPTFFPNPDNCNQFFECSHGVPILVSCPPDLFFCSQLQSCSWQWDPNCVYTCVVVDNNRPTRCSFIVGSALVSGSCTVFVPHHVSSLRISRLTQCGLIGVATGDVTIQGLRVTWTVTVFSLGSTTVRLPWSNAYATVTGSTQCPSGGTVTARLN